MRIYYFNVSFYFLFYFENYFNYVKIQWSNIAALKVTRMAIAFSRRIPEHLKEPRRLPQ